jgi:hypothetical protein
MRNLAILGVLAFSACNSIRPDETPPASGWTADFSLPLGPVPEPWRVDSTNPEGPNATWEIQADPSAPSPPNVLALESVNHDSEPTFNLCWSSSYAFQDGTIDVAMRSRDGVLDQGGGLAWRIRGPRDYFVCRYNPLESNFRLYIVAGSSRRQLASIQVPERKDPWSRIHVEHQGDHIRCTLDGEFTIEATNPSLRGPGGVGVWTKADARTKFDDLAIRPR